MGEKDEACLLENMNEVQTHRGPDDDGKFFCERNGVYLAMRRLSIIDLEGGHQPMSTRDGRYWVVFNGEIFNAIELRQELEAEGIQFRTDHSDTEVLLHLYARHGRDMMQMLNGMFAFVIYDREAARLFCARDPFGIKPFYYSTVRGRFCFSSELKSLKQLPWVPRDLDHQAIYHYFSFQSIPLPYSILKNVRKLPAAHWLEWDLKRKKLEIQRYWEPEFGTNLPVSEEDLPDYILSEFRQAVKRWSLSDVPVACSLSGGLDSSSITAVLSEQGGQSLRTYTLGFEDAEELDERHLARQVAEYYGTDHHEIVIHSDDLLQELDKILYHLDEPYAGGLPSWFVFKAMAEDVKVGMSGTGGDELFGNYGKWTILEHPIDRLSAYRNFIRDGGSWKGLVMSNKASIYRPMYFSDHLKRKKLFNQDFLESINECSTQLINQLWDPVLSTRDAISKLDLNLQLPEEFLLMTDRFSMAFSLEMRTPFLDREFVKKMYSIPSVIRTERGNLKRPFKDAIRTLIPAGSINAPKKGFVLPQKKWLQESLKSELIHFSEKSHLKRQNIFRYDLLEKMITPFLSNKINNSNQIWTWWMFQKWFDSNQEISQ